MRGRGWGVIPSDSGLLWGLGGKLTQNRTGGEAEFPAAPGNSPTEGRSEGQPLAGINPPWSNKIPAQEGAVEHGPSGSTPPQSWGRILLRENSRTRNSPPQKLRDEGTQQGHLSLLPPSALPVRV